MQPTPGLKVQRMNDGWIVYIMGSPVTKHSTYLYLRHDGTCERVTINDGYEVDIVRVTL